MPYKNPRLIQNIMIEQITNYLELLTHSSTPLVPKFMLKHGIPCYMSNRTFAGPRGTPRRCFMNAFNAVSDDKSLTYVEGWCHMGIIPIEHAWYLDPKGRVVDPTLSEASGYFGIPFQRDYVLSTAVRTGIYGVITNANRELFTTPTKKFLADRSPAREAQIVM